jgi:hypothetical protein
MPIIHVVTQRTQDGYSEYIDSLFSTEELALERIAAIDNPPPNMAYSCRHILGTAHETETDGTWAIYPMEIDEAKITFNPSEETHA